MDRFDYRIPSTATYISTGKTPGPVKKPVAWGSTSAFSESQSVDVGYGLTQVIIEPVVDNTVAFTVGDIPVKYMYNGVYLVDNATRVVANTGPILAKIAITETEVSIGIDDVNVRISKPMPAQVSIELSPSGDTLYDKFLYELDIPEEQLVNKSILTSMQDEGSLSPISYDKLYDPKLVLAEDMDIVEDYYVACRKLTEANTSVVFYSDIQQIEKSIDGVDWSPVDPVEYHGEDALIFRSKDPSFALRFYDTNIDDFKIRGGQTSVTGEIYKIGNDIGTFFAHDSYLIKDGSLEISADEMTHVSILGYLPQTLVDEFSPQVDFGATVGKMHLYTIECSDSINLIADEIYVSAIGINLNHNEVLEHLSGISQVSYADEIENIQLGTAINSEEEYAILDVQWSM